MCGHLFVHCIALPHLPCNLNEFIHWDERGISQEDAQMANKANMVLTHVGEHKLTTLGRFR